MMRMITNIKLTQNQQLVVNAFLSMVGAALVGMGQATYQYLSHGNVSVAEAFAFALGIFWAGFSAALFAYIPAHVQQELAAWQDTATMAQQELNTLKAKPVIPAQPLVVIHATGASVQNTPAPQRADTVQSVPTTAPTRDIAPVPMPAAPQPEQSAQLVMLTNPTGASTVPLPMDDDLLGDLPAASGVAQNVSQITGHIPTYGATRK